MSSPNEAYMDDKPSPTAQINLIDGDDIIIEEASGEGFSHTASVSEIQCQHQISNISNMTGDEISKLVKLLKNNSQKS